MIPAGLISNPRTTLGLEVWRHFVSPERQRMRSAAGKGPDQSREPSQGTAATSPEVPGAAQAFVSGQHGCAACRDETETVQAVLLGTLIKRECETSHLVYK